MPLSFVDAAQVEFGNMSLALPFGQLTRFDPYYPAAFVGAEHRWSDRRVVDVAQVGRFGGFHHAVRDVAVSEVFDEDMWDAFAEAAGIPPTAP